MEERKFLHALNLTNEFRYERARKLFEAFGSFEKIWSASLKELSPFFEHSHSPEALNTFLGSREKTDAEQEWRRLKEREISFYTFSSPEYPEELRQTPWPPLGIYVKGEIQNELPRVSIVGTRRASPYGRESASVFSRRVSEAGVTVVSGLALGIDQAAHEGALQADSPTWAVLGSGIENIYPRANNALARKILKNKGALISEYPPGFSAREWTFPERNRIIAGLSKLIIVIEAPERSGALITARLALEAGRDVGVLPADITRSSFLGSNRLLRDGAHPLLEPEDALLVLGISPKPKSEKLDNFDKTSQSILQYLTEPKSADEIILATGLSPKLISQKLVELEIQNMIRQGAGLWQKT